MGIDPQQYREWYGVLPGAENRNTSRNTIPESISFPSRAGLDLKAQNELVAQWSSMVQQHLRGATVILQHGKDGTVSRPAKAPVRTERKLENSILASTRQHYGISDRVSFKFERHGVFVHKGVGRGYEMQGGMVIRTAKSEDSLTSNAIGRARVPYEWFNPVLERTLPELADKLAEINADAVLNSTRMMIK